MKEQKCKHCEIREYDGYSIPEPVLNITEEERKQKIAEAEVRIKELLKKYERFKNKSRSTVADCGPKNRKRTGL